MSGWLQVDDRRLDVGIRKAGNTTRMINLCILRLILTVIIVIIIIIIIVVIQRSKLS